MSWHRYTRTLERLTVEPARGTIFRPGVSILLTGACGGLGLLLSRHLALHYHVRPLLLDRLPAPGDSTTEQLSPAQAAHREALGRLLEELRHAGSEAHYLQIDLTAPGALARGLDQLRTLYGPLAGIFHLAGTLHPSLLRSSTAEHFEATFAPKAGVLEELDRLTADDPLEAFVVFSSILSLFGHEGMSAYAAANGYLDAFAAQRDRLVLEGKRRGKTVAINWPLWDEGGMQADEAFLTMLRDRGLGILSTAEGLATFDLALTLEQPRIAVFVRPQGSTGSPLEAPPPLARVPLPEPAAIAEDPASPRISEQLETAVLSLVTALSPDDRPDLDADTDFGEFGLDSVAMTKLSDQLNKRFTLRLTPAVLFEFTSVRGLTDYLREEYPSLASPPTPEKTEGPRVESPLPTAAAPVAPSPGSDFELPRPQDIAIIGLGGLYPGSPDPWTLWKNLAAERDLITEVPPERWTGEDFYGDPLTERNRSNSRWGGFLQNVAGFDAEFFRISPREAQLMDPQQRLLLQVVWQTLEDAGLPPNSLVGKRVGVFVAAGTQDYEGLLIANGLDIEAHNATGTFFSILANRVSYTFDFTGPSFPVDTACSGSLMALHTAVRSLQAGDCDLALAGGVLLNLSPRIFIAFGKAGMLSPDGRCKTFDATANGYVRGEGVGAVVLAPARTALTDGRHIYALIKGSAINHGGKARTLTSPNPTAQAAVIDQALTEAAVDAGTIGYIETHGTATNLGDPIELNGLKKAFAPLTDTIGTCGLGSVKSNLGHLEAAAGMVGLAKVLLSMHHGILPATLHLENPNPYIDLEGSPFYLCRSTAPWKHLHDLQGRTLPYRAGLSSFGFGGANGHLILEEVLLPQDKLERTGLAQVLTFSARTRASLLLLLGRYQAQLRERQALGRSPSLYDLGHTLRNGRQAQEHRLALVAEDLEPALAAIEDILSGTTPAIPCFEGTATKSPAKNGDPLRPSDVLEAARAWSEGRSVEWKQLYPQLGRIIPLLPTYPFDAKPYWFNADPQSIGRWPSPPPPVRSGRSDHLEPSKSREPDLVSVEELVRSVESVAPGTERLLVTFFDDLDTYAAMRVFDHLRTVGLFTASGRQTDEAGLFAALVVHDRHRRLVLALVNHLLERGWLGRNAERYVATPASATEVTAAELTRLREDLDTAVPSRRAHLALLETCLDRLPDLLRDLVAATEIVFPGASMHLVEDIYDHNALADHFNRAAASLLAAYSTRLCQAGRSPLRLLEVGAGTGGATEQVLRALAPFGSSCRYVYTDRSPGFLAFARGKFSKAAIPMEFKLLDLERSPASQGVTPGFDAILASNVLHATTDLGRTLTHLHGLLEPGGLLLANEMLRPGAFLTATFGLLDGWWNFGDSRHRLPHGPLLSAQGWCSLLEEQGFSEPTCTAFGGEHSENLPQALILGRRDPQAAGNAKLLASAAALDIRTPTPAPAIVRTADRRLSDVLLACLTEAFALDPATVDETRPFSDYGLDSIVAVAFIQLLNDRLGQDLKASVLFDHRDLASLGTWLQTSRPECVGAAATQPTGPAPGQTEPPPVGEVTPCSPKLPGQPSDQRIAVIGMAAKVPGADEVETFWRNLAAGVDSITEIPAHRFDFRAHFDPTPGLPGKTYSKWGGFVSDVDSFDPLFFNLSGREAALTDPQQRLFLQTAWHCLEDGGQTQQGLAKSRCGIYAGVLPGDYQQHVLAAGNPTDAHLFTGNASSVLSARLAYCLDLKGPSLSVDTACSSSLVALHLACQGLLRGDCDLALAGGAFVMTGIDFHVLCSQVRMLSPVGRCKTFDAEADGFVPGEGASVVLLKRYEDALADGDRLHGVILATGLNQDGRTYGITAPSAAAQTALELEVYHRAGIDPASLSYIEAHGTGTRLGDPVELDALTAAFAASGAAAPGSRTCALGSVKTNLGHLSPAAGVTGLIKVLLCLRHRQLVPSLHYHTPNPQLDLEAGPFYVNTDLQPWNPSPGSPRRAALSSFGWSGTNAHLVLEEAPEPELFPSRIERNGLVWPFALSAITDEVLQEVRRKLAAWLRERTGLPLAALSYTLAYRRSHFSRRFACLAATADELAAILEGQAPTGTPDGTQRSKSLATWAQRYQVSGELPSEDLYGKAERRVLSLPPYPFLRQRYWYQSEKAGEAVQQVGAKVPPFLFLQAWEPVSPTHPRSHRPALILTTGKPDGLAGELALLLAKKRHVRVVALGHRHCDLPGSHAERRFDDDQALAELLTGDSPPSEVYFLPEPLDQDRPDYLRHRLPYYEQRQLHVLVRVLRQLGRRAPGSCTLVVAVSGLSAVQPGETVDFPLHGTLPGLCHAAAQEYPGLTVVCCDLRWEDMRNPSLRSALLARLAEPTLVPGTTALRSSGQLCRVLLPYSPDSLPGSSLFRRGGHYLICGGAGGLGQLLAAWILRREDTSVALTGRSEVEPARLAALGSPERLRYYRCDLTVPEQVGALRRKVLDTWGSLEGVIHSAVSLQDCTLANLRPEILEPGLAAKVRGSHVLDDAFSGDDLDFFLHCSSYFSLVGNVGQGTYCAASTFQDAFAAYQRRRRAYPVKVIDWGYLGDLGISAGPRFAAEAPALGFLPLGLEALHLALEVCLRDKGPNLLVAARFTEDLLASMRLPGNGERYLPGLFTALPAGDPPAPEPSPSPPRAPAPLERELLELRLASSLAGTLKISPGLLEPEAPFQRYGVDSLLGLDLVQRLNAEFGLQLRPADLYNYGSLRQLADHVLQRYPHLGRPPVAPSSEVPRPPDPPRPTAAAKPMLALDKASLSLDVAVIGFSCRFPGAPNAEAFWELLRAGRHVLGDFPEERFSGHATYEHLVREQSRNLWRRGGYLEEIDRFDPLFFGLSPREALCMDPQQRLLLEESWHALEHAGYVAEGPRGLAYGVFIGVSEGDYDLLLLDRRVPPDTFTMTGITSSILAGRIAYTLDLRGPALAVDTACSSSLVAVHLACQSLLAGECDLALAGGVNVFSTPRVQLSLAAMGSLAGDGRCKAFDASADGFVPAEGVGVVVLKPLAKALADRDTIHAVLKASGINQDGRTNGLTAPSARSQKDLLLGTYRRHGLDPADVQLVEAHGTGTALGDPIELQALDEAFSELTTQPHCWYLGSVKTNFGHALAAAGIASLLKIVLALRHRELPATLHWSRGTEPLLSSAFTLNPKTLSWPEPSEGPRRAALSAFGFSGTNCHLVVEEAPRNPKPFPEVDSGAQAILLSARSWPAYRQRLEDLRSYLAAEHPPLPWLAATLALGRKHLACRGALVVEDLAELRSKLEALSAGEPVAGYLTTPEHRAPASPAMHRLAHELVKRLREPREEPGSRREDLTVLCDCQVQGVEPPWEALYAGTDFRRIPLPGTPFERDRYWIAQTARNEEIVSQLPPAPKPVLFALGREERPAPSSLPGVGTWLLLARPDQSALVSFLRSGGNQRWRVLVCAEARENGTGFDPRSEAQAGGLCEALLEELPDLVGSLDLCDLAPPDDPPFRFEQHLGHLAFLQRLVAGTRGRPFRILHVLDSRRGASGGWFFEGLYGLLGAEYRHLRATSLALDAESPDLARRCLEEVHRPGGLSFVEYRGNARWGRTLELVPEPEGPLGLLGPHPVLSGSTYLLTGATRGLGATLARRLVAAGARHLALTGLRDLPCGASRDHVRLLAPDDPKLRATLALLRELEEAGATVDLFCGNLERGPEFTAFLQGALSRSKGLAGVFHCAGLDLQTEPAFVRKKSADIARVLEPKFGGLLSVWAAVRPHEPAFVTLFSSISSLLPSLAVGLLEYAAANHVLNRFAELHDDPAGLRVQALAWPSWRESGRGANTSRPFLASGFQAHTDDQGFSLLGRCLASSAPVLLPGVADPTRLDARALLAPEAVSAPTPRLLVAASSTEASPGSGLAAKVQRIFRKELGLRPEQLDPEAEFGTLGVDSILMAGLIAQLEEVVGTKLNPSILLEYPTLHSLLEHLGARPERGCPSSDPPAPAGQGPGYPPVRKTSGTEPIAVIGLACRFPGSPDAATFWRNLCQGVNSIGPYPRERLALTGPVSATAIPNWRGGFLENIEYFDPTFFSLPLAVAEHLDPLTRLVLETAVTTLHHAGYSRDDLAGRNLGVFLGARSGNFSRLLEHFRKDSLVGIGQNFIAALAAHCFDWHGPNLIVDTACSSALTSLHLARQSLLLGECEAALAGGVDLLFDERFFESLEAAGALAPDGQCKTFDERADGFVPGEGCGLLLLKTLSAAQRDGDRILALLRSSALNNDGKTMGLTTPSLEGQLEVLRKAYVGLDRSPAELGYLETHGTGTTIGDPIELKALSRFLEPHTSERMFCGVGSVKTNLGHLLSAAGAASVIKVVLALAEGVLPATLNCERPNPRFDFHASPFYPVLARSPWLRRRGPLLAGVSGFGFGGTNGHVVLEEAPTSQGSRPTRHPLPPPRFERRRCWPRPPVGEKPEPTTAGTSLNGLAAFLTLTREVERP